MSWLPAETSVVVFGSPGPNVAVPPNPPVTTLEPSEKALMPPPRSSCVPPARFAQASVPSALYLAIHISSTPAETSVVAFGSPGPNMALPRKLPVMMLEPSEKVLMPVPRSKLPPPARFAQASVPSALYLATNISTSAETSVVLFDSPAPNTAVPWKTPVITLEPSKKVLMPKPCTEIVPPALFAQTSVSSSLYLAMNMPWLPAETSVVVFSSFAPNVAVSLKNPVTTLEPSKKVLMPVP